MNDHPASVYRLFDAENRLLYVGCGSCVHSRLDEHRRSKDWFPAVARTEVERFPTRREALVAELEAIQAEDPIYNISGKVLEAKPQIKLNVVIDPAVHEELKRYAFERGTSMRELVEDAIEGVILKDARASAAVAR